MTYAIYADIEGYLNQNMKIISNRPHYGEIGITQVEQFYIISKEGILIMPYNYKVPLDHKYKVWTMKNEVVGAQIYDALLANFAPGLKELDLTKRANLVSGEVYIYTI